MRGRKPVCKSVCDSLGSHDSGPPHRTVKVYTFSIKHARLTFSALEDLEGASTASEVRVVSLSRLLSQH